MNGILFKKKKFPNKKCKINHDIQLTSYIFHTNFLIVITIWIMLGFAI